LVVDRYPMRIVATVFGLIAGGSALGGFASTRIVGEIASTGSYDAIFLLMGLLHPLAWLMAWLSTRTKQ
jgi:ACS family hexuronate transporter-like MFS transporter